VVPGSASTNAAVVSPVVAPASAASQTTEIPK
jgi:hypothetical protein